MQEHDQKRADMRRRARYRQKAERIAYTRALYLVRRSAILVELSRAERPVTPAELARATAVPLGVARNVCGKLLREEHPYAPMIAPEKTSDGAIFGDSEAQP